MFVVLIIFVAILSICCWLYNAVTDISNADKLNTTASTNIYQPMVKSVVLGQPQEITDDDINGIIAKIINSSLKNETRESHSVVAVKGASLYTQGGNTANLYVDLQYKQYRIIFSADAKVQLDTDSKIITICLSNTKLGSLNVPVGFVTGKIAKSLTEINSSIQVYKDSIVIPSEYNLEFLDKNVTLYIADLQLNQGNATIQTNSAMDVISQFIDEIIEGIFN